MEEESSEPVVPKAKPRRFSIFADELEALAVAQQAEQQQEVGLGQNGEGFMFECLFFWQSV